MNMTEIQQMLGGMMRAIDKKTALTVEIAKDAEPPAVAVRLSRDKRVGSLQFSETHLVEAQTNLIRRDQLRTALKRARDRMWQETGYIFSTKLVQRKNESSWARPSHGGRGRR